MSTHTFFVFCLVYVGVQVLAQNSARCNVPPSAPKKVEEVINTCQDEIKLQILQEALAALQINANEKHREKRAAFSEEDKRIAGCLLQCVYRKMGALNEQGFPTIEGLVNLYTTGVEDKGYKLATYQGVYNCLNLAQKKHLVTPQALEVPGKTCDIAYDVFDCVSEEVGQYCGQTP